MIYAIYATDVADSLELRKQFRPAHLARIEGLNEQGRLLLAGPMPKVDAIDMPQAGYSGSLIVAEFENLTEAQSWADADPFFTAGVYKQVSVKPYIKVLP